MRPFRTVLTLFCLAMAGLALSACGGEEGGEAPVTLPDATPGDAGGAKPDGPMQADAPEPGDTSGKTPESDAPAAVGGAEGAKALLAEALKPGADLARLSATLRPSTADYAAVLKGDAAAKAEAHYKAAWDLGRLVLARKPDQTELLVWAATSEELQKGTGNAREFPGGYRSVVQHFQPGITWYRFKFVEPGSTSGMAYDGLVFVNGRWVIIPKPWRALR